MQPIACWLQAWQPSLYLLVRVAYWPSFLVSTLFGYVFLAVKQITAKTRLAVVACVKILAVYSIVILAIRSEYFTIADMGSGGYEILLNIGIISIVLVYAIISDKNWSQQAR